MILVAATAVGCAYVQWIGRASGGDFAWSAAYEGFRDLFGGWPDGDWAVVVGQTADLGVLIAVLTMPVVAIWTLALIPIRLVGPRPQLRRFARQPGMMATCASRLAIAFAGLGVLVMVLATEMELFDPLEDLGVLTPFVPMFIGWSVLLSWLTLLIGRRWRAEPSWVDRLGRIAGVFWIVAGFAVTSLFLVSPMAHSHPFRVDEPILLPAVEAVGENAEPGSKP